MSKHLLVVWQRSCMNACGISLLPPVEFGSALEKLIVDVVPRVLGWSIDVKLSSLRFFSINKHKM